MNTYSVTTGVLVFDGAPNITEGLKAWLHPVQHRGPQDIPPDDTYLGVPGVGIFQEDEDSVYIDDLQGAIETALRARGVEPDDQADMGELVEQLIEVSGVGEAAAWIKDKIQQEEKAAEQFSIPVECIGVAQYEDLPKCLESPPERTRPSGG